MLAIVVNLFPFLHTPSHTTHLHTPHTFTNHTPSQTTHLHTPHTFTNHTPSHSLSVAVALPVEWVSPAEEENFVSSLSGNLISRKERGEGEKGGQKKEGRREKRMGRNATQLYVQNGQDITSQVRVLVLTLFRGNLQ